MSHFNGKQRDLEDWKKIFEAVDERLRLSNLVVRPGSVLSIIELFLQDAPVTNGHPEVAEVVAKTNGVHHEEAEVEQKPGTNGVNGEEHAALATESVPPSEVPAEEPVQATLEAVTAPEAAVTVAAAIEIPTADAQPSAVESVEEISMIASEAETVQPPVAVHAHPAVYTAA
jgi:hypothetical protein